VDVLIEYSVDAGVTFQTATMAATSPTPNPAAALANGLYSFHWHSRDDGVGLAALAVGVIIRVTVDDGISPYTGTCTQTIDIDNTAICGHACGDCNLDAMGPSVIDALLAAQIAAGLQTPNPEQEGCCDVDASMAVTVLDALQIARESAGLSVVLTCL
jgi:hypothetical protein